MPRNSIDYSKCVIYKIVCKDFSIKDLYVGSTTDFVKRRSVHKKECNDDKIRKVDLKIYKIIRVNGGWENWSIIAIEDYKLCKSSNDAKERERYWFELLSIKNIIYKEKVVVKCDTCHHDLNDLNKHKRLNRCLECSEFIESQYKNRKNRFTFLNNCSCPAGFRGEGAFCKAHRG